MRDDSRFSRRDGEEAFCELKRLASTGVAIYFYVDGSRFRYGTFGDNVVGFVRAEMNAEYRRSRASEFTDQVRASRLFTSPHSRSNRPRYFRSRSASFATLFRSRDRSNSVRPAAERVAA
jgi:hypothetical protein